MSKLCKKCEEPYCCDYAYSECVFCQADEIAALKNERDALAKRAAYLEKMVDKRWLTAEHQEQRGW